LINRLADSAERIEPLLATLALVEEAPNRLFDQFVTAPIVAVSEFPLDLFCQIRRQRYVHDRFLSSGSPGILPASRFDRWRRAPRRSTPRTTGRPARRLQ
jgi:hypothetical protein